MVRAKFRVSTITAHDGSPAMTTIKLTPVYANSDPNHENSKFWKYTPSGSIDLSCCNPEAVKQFELGKEYYIDFSPATVQAPAQ